MKETLVLFISITAFQIYMISHLLGNPHGPSLSFSFFCGTADVVAGAACPVEVAGAVVVAGAEVPFAVVLSVTTAFFSPFCCPSSHGCALETAS
jgi:hypothetical protein